MFLWYTGGGDWIGFFEAFDFFCIIISTHPNRRHDIDERSRNERRAEIGDEGVHAPSVIKLAEFSTTRVENFDETLDKASEYLLEEGSEAKIRRKAKN